MDKGTFQKSSTLMGLGEVAFLITACLFFGCNTNPPHHNRHRNPLHGMIYREASTLPGFKGYEDLGGSVIGDVDSAGNYGFGIEVLKNGTDHVVIFERIIPRKDTSVPFYELLDTLEVHGITDSMEVFYGLCRQDTVSNSAIVAVAYLDKEPYFKRVVKAWRADYKTQSFVSIPDTKNIDCINLEDTFDCPDE